MTKAKRFKRWVTHEVIPSLRKYGFYEIRHEDKQIIEELNDRLLEKDERIRVLERNQKKEKYPLGGIIYVMQSNVDDTDLFKIGITNDMNARINTYGTSFADNPNIIHWMPIKNPKQVEECVKSVLHEYRYRGNGKEFYKCEPEDIINGIENCIVFIPTGTQKMARQKIFDLFSGLDQDKKYIIEFEPINYEDNEQTGGSDSYSTNQHKYRDMYLHNKMMYKTLNMIEQNQLKDNCLCDNSKIVTCKQKGIDNNF